MMAMPDTDVEKDTRDMAWSVGDLVGYMDLGSMWRLSLTWPAAVVALRLMS